MTIQLNHRGVTLLELIITLSIASVVAMAIGSVYSSYIRSFQTTAKTENTLDVAVALEYLSRDTFSSTDISMGNADPLSDFPNGSDVEVTSGLMLSSVTPPSFNNGELTSRYEIEPPASADQHNGKIYRCANPSVAGACDSKELIGQGFDKLTATRLSTGGVSPENQIQYAFWVETSSTTVMGLLRKGAVRVSSPS